MIGWRIPRGFRPLAGFRPNAKGAGASDLIFHTQVAEYQIDYGIGWFLIEDSGSAILVRGDSADLLFYSDLARYSGVKIAGGNLYLTITNPDDPDEIHRFSPGGAIDTLI